MTKGCPVQALQALDIRSNIWAGVPPPGRIAYVCFVTEPTGDATRRTWLATERTWLAWVRTGLASTAVALGVGKITPELSNASTTWPYIAIGAGNALLGAALVAYGFTRRREVDDAIGRGTYIPPASGPIAVFAIAGVVLGLATFVVVLAD